MSDVPASNSPFVTFASHADGQLANVMQAALDFQAVLPTLSADQQQKWLALYNAAFRSARDYQDAVALAREAVKYVVIHRCDGPGNYRLIETCIHRMIAFSSVPLGFIWDTVRSIYPYMPKEPPLPRGCKSLVPFDPDAAAVPPPAPWEPPRLPPPAINTTPSYPQVDDPLNPWPYTYTTWKATADVVHDLGTSDQRAVRTMQAPPVTWFSQADVTVLDSFGSDKTQANNGPG